MSREEEFQLFMSQLLDTNYSLDTYCDFDKVARNVEDIKLSLCILNSLIGSTDLRRSVETIWKRDKSAFSVMGILIAVRRKDKKKFIDACGNYRLVCDMFETVDDIMEYLEGTGLAEVFQSKKIKDLTDYVFGVEAGMDTNARKNRGGENMERIVGNAFTRAGIKYEEQIKSTTWPSVDAVLGKDKKVFDFVVKVAKKTYLIEVNFYSGGGSKLNEVARAYSDIAPKINSVNEFEFVWITDGIGWNSAKNKLQEAFSIIPRVYNLTTLKDFLAEIKNS